LPILWPRYWGILEVQRLCGKTDYLPTPSGKGNPHPGGLAAGQLKDSRAVPPLIDLVKKTEDVYIAGAAVQALGEIGTPEAHAFLGSLIQHQAKMVRDEARRILSGRNRA